MGLTAQGGRAQNRAVAVRHCSVHVLLLVIAFAANAALAPCGGWQASAKARMVCCAAGDHECSQARADDCCVAGEQRQHSETSGVPAPALTTSQTAVAVYLGTPPDGPAPGARVPRAEYPIGSPPDTYLLLSVFLI